MQVVGVQFTIEVLDDLPAHYDGDDEDGDAVDEVERDFHVVGDAFVTNSKHP